MTVRVKGRETESGSLAFDIVAVSGDPVPGSTSETFRSFGSGDDGPALNELGETAFRALMTDGEGVFTTRHGRLEAVARTGDPAPDTGRTFTGLNAPNLNDEGEVAFFAESDGVAGVFFATRGQLRKLAQTGDRVPDGSAVLAAFRGSIPLLNNRGDVAFVGEFDGGEGVFVVQGRTGELHAVALTGQRVPGATGEETFTGFSLPVLNDAGQVALQGLFEGGEGLFVTQGNWLEPVALTGDRIDGERFEAFSRPALNRAGDVAFRASFGASRGVFLAREQQLRTVIQTRDSLPGADDVLFVDAHRPVLNNAGDVAIQGLFDDGLAGIDALLLCRQEELTVVHQQESGEPTLFDMVLNDQGELSFELSDIGSVLLVTRCGQPQRVPPDNTLEVRPGDVLDLERVDLLSGDGKFVYASNGDGLPSGFNNNGQVAFLASSVSAQAIALASPQQVFVSR